MKITFKKNGSLKIPYEIHTDWVVKVPTKKNRLIRDGSVGLDYGEKYDLKNKKGVIYIDVSSKSYIIIPKTCFEEEAPELKACNGIKNSIASWSVKGLIEKYGLQLIPIIYEADIVPEHKQGLAGDIRKRFGL
jgi:hypothetical protein